MGRTFLIATILALTGACAAPRPVALAPPPSLENRVRDVMGALGAGVRYGVVVTTAEGAELLAIAPDERFVPASNTKIFTTLTAMATLPDLDQPDRAGAATARLVPDARHGSDVMLEGHGDARLSSDPICAADCLSQIADGIAAKTRKIHDVVGDDSFFPDERWPQGMSWNNLATRSGTAISALSIDDNELAMKVGPAGAEGATPVIEGYPYYTIHNVARTVAGAESKLDISRMPGSNDVRLSGSIGVNAPSVMFHLSIDDPALFSAWRLKSLLEARGVKVTGTARSVHRPPDVPAAPPSTGEFRTEPPPLIDTITRTDKVSQNLYAELLLRRIGRVGGGGSVAEGHRVMQGLLDRIGVSRAGYDLSDASGMSSYNRVSPRAMATLLRWAEQQKWRVMLRGLLPIAGVDGTLARRFTGTPLQGVLQAKTGTLNATSALSGYMRGNSGKQLIFAIFIGDVPDAQPINATLDKAILMIAASN